MKQYIIFCLLLTWLFSCKNIESESAILEIKPNFENNSESTINKIFKSIEFVSLEANSAALISFVHKAVMDDSIIVTLDLSTNAVMIFDRQGNHIKTLNKGRGPGEYLSVTDINLNSYDKSVEILDMFSIIRKYDYEGSFINSISFASSQRKVRFFPIDSEAYFFSIPGFGYPLASLSYDSKNNSSILLERPPSLAYDRNISNWNFSEELNIVYYFNRYNDTIYSLEKSGANPLFYINFGSNRIKASDLIKDISEEDQGKVKKALSKNTYFDGPFFKDGNILFFGIAGSLEPHKCIYNLSNGKSILIKSYSDNIGFDFPFYPIYPVGFSNGHVIFSSSPEKVINRYKSTYLGHSIKWNKFKKEFPFLADIVVKEDISSNPFLILCELSDSLLK